MKEENQIKGCLIRNSGIVLCILVQFFIDLVDARNGSIRMTQWNPNDKIAKREFDRMKSKVIF